MSKHFINCVLLVIFLNSWLITSQTNVEKELPLIEVIQGIEQKYNITFTFADENIKGIFILPPKDDLSLEAVLNYLRIETQLKFNQISKKSIIIQLHNELQLNNIQFLNEVVVTNYLTKGISLNEDGITKIKPSQFNILPGLTEPDVLNAIQALPGVLSVDERVSNINVRGGTNDQNLVLWDGIKMYQSGHFFGLISAFNPYLNENVVVSKNGTSAMYGDGVSSIIDMRSSNEISNEFNGGTGINLIHADAYAKIPINKKTEAQFSIRRSITDILTTPTYDSYFKRIFQDTDLTSSASISKNERFYFYDISGKILYNLSEKDKIRIKALNIYNQLDYQESSSINNIDEALNSKLIQHNLALGLSYERAWSNKFSTYADIYLSNYDLDATNFDVINDQRLIQENEVYDGGIKVHFNYLFNNKLSYFGGYQFSEVGISNLEDVNNPVYRRYIKEVLRSHTFFNEVTFNSSSRNTHAKIGLRTNYIEKFSKFLIEPRFSFSQKFLTNFRFELLGEIKSQNTTQVIDLQNDFLGVEKRRWILANDMDIPIVKSKQLSAGIQFKKDEWLVSLEGYYKNVEGITTRSQGFQNQYQFVNSIGDYTVKGLDLLINKQLKNLSSWISYSYSKNDYTFPELNFGNSFPNNADITHAFSFASTYSIGKFKMALGANWRSGKPFTQPNLQQPQSDNFISYDTPNNLNLPEYFRIDLSATYKLDLGKDIESTAGFSLWNVLDRNNVINTYFVRDESQNIIKVENYSLGLTPNFSYRVTF